VRHYHLDFTFYRSPIAISSVGVSNESAMSSKTSNSHDYFTLHISPNLFSTQNSPISTHDISSHPKKSSKLTQKLPLLKH
jgi:hypothetical protein